MPLITTIELAIRLKRTQTAITKAARSGRFGDAAHRGPRGAWLFDWPRAAELFRARTDPTRLGEKTLPKAPPAEPLVAVYESERGRLELPRATVAELDRLAEHPDEPGLTEELQGALDAILWIVGTPKEPAT